MKPNNGLTYGQIEQIKEIEQLNIKSGKFKLKRTVQCAKCPFKVDTDPYEIPDGYCSIKHKKLQDTIIKKTT